MSLEDDFLTLYIHASTHTHTQNHNIYLKILMCTIKSLSYFSASLVFVPYSIVS